MKIKTFFSILEELCAPNPADLGESPWLEIARDRYRRGWFRAIPMRDDPEELYLARFWLCTPRLAHSEHGERWDSGDATLLHFIHAADDDEALHDHPWPFTTAVVAGEYREAIPSREWHASQLRSAQGPCVENIIRMPCGATRRHTATSLHRIVSVTPGTWTIVFTGARHRQWGFHPPGKRWMNERDYLKPARGTQAPR